MTKKEIKNFKMVVHEENEIWHLKLKEKKYLSKTMMRMTFTGDNVRHIDSNCIDEYTVIWMIDEESGKTAYPVIKDGEIIFPKENSVARDMTFRAIRAKENEVDIDFVLHDKGFKTGWAEKAKIGDSVYMLSPAASSRVSLDYDYYYAVTDQTGLPSVENLIEKLPESSKGIVYIYAPNKDSKYKLFPHPGFEINWIYTDDNPPSMLERVKSLKFDKEKNIFFAAMGSSKDIREIKKLFENNESLTHMDGHYTLMYSY